MKTKNILFILFVLLFINFNAVAQCPAPVHPDYLAMVDLYNSTNGPGWTNKTGWEAGAAGTNCDPCSGWYGVNCNTNGRVIGISLPGNNLTGYISIIYFEELIELYLQQNQIEGTLPEINCAKLQYIEFSTNNFTSINTIYGINAPLLTTYVLNDNELAGCISSSYSVLCTQGTQVFLEDNPGFNANSWTNFCTNGTGGCNTPQGTCPDFVQIQNPEEICDGEDFSINVTLIGGNPPFRLVLEDEYDPGVDIVVVENVTERNYTFEFNGSSGLPIPSLGAHNYRVGHRIIEPGLIQTCFIEETPVSNDLLVVNSLSADFNTVPDKGSGNGSCEVVFNSNGENYTFSWSGPISGSTETNASPLIITDLPTGSYNVTITKSPGACFTEFSFNIDLDTGGNGCNHPDYAELMKLYNRTGGPNWTNNTGWKEGAAGTNCDPCTWYGIECDSNRVIGIDLDGIINFKHDYDGLGNNLIGNLPNIKIPFLKILSFASDSIFGELPNFDLDRLQILAITDSYLSGPVPKFDLPSLEFLWLTQNYLSGSLPIFNFPRIKRIVFLFSNISGTVPAFNYLTLEQLAISHCKLSGQIPDLNLPSLLFLNLELNELSGNIPNFTFDKIRHIELQGNNLSGIIPNFKFRDLSWLLLGGNDLSGNIPIFDLPNLEILWLHSNNLTGSIPVMKIPKITRINLYNNNLSGCIPSIFKTYCQNITEADISKNPNLATESWSDFCSTGAGMCDDVCSLYLDNAINIDITQGSFSLADVSTGFNSICKFSFDINSIDTLFSLNCSELGSNYVFVYDSSHVKVDSILLTLTDTSGICNNGCLHPDFASLIKLFDSLNGLNWKNNGTNNEPKSTTKGWAKDCDICNWYGIKCNSNNRVTCLDLDGINNCEWDFNSGNNNMTGTIPEISFSEIEFFNLSNNGLVGKLSSLALPKVKSLNVTDSKLTGSLTDFNLNLLTLEEIRLQYNQLSGSIPNFNSQNLKIIDFGGNNLTGSLPNMETPNLQYLSFGTNSLTGSIPAYNLPLLHTIYLHNNQFTGSLPEFTFPNIKIIRIENNNLSGCIPVQYLNFCSSNIEVNIANNPDLSTDSWDAFCNDNEGICCFKPLVQGFSITGSIDEVNEVELKNYGLYPEMSSLKIIEIRNNQLNQYDCSEDGILSYSFDKHFFGEVEVVVEACGLDCNECDTMVVKISDAYLPYIHPTNAFTPNVGTNQTLRFNDDDNIPESELFIYNRWGDRIYYAKDYTNDWNANGYPGGIYFYVLKVQDVILKSTLTIIK